MKFSPPPDAALGLGTRRVGGSAMPDTSQDARALHALRYAPDARHRHPDTTGMYAAGHPEELTGRALRENGLPLTAYTPLEKGRPAQDNAPASIAKRRDLTPARVGPARLLNQPGVITIPKTLNPRRPEENLATADVQLSPEETRLLDVLE